VRYRKFQMIAVRCLIGLKAGFRSSRRARRHPSSDVEIRFGLAVLAHAGALGRVPESRSRSCSRWAAAYAATQSLRDPPLQ
jgi:hypothetical protein